MEVITLVATAFVAPLALAVVHYLRRGRFEVLELKIEHLDDKVEHLNEKVDGHATLMADLGKQIAGMRSDLTYVALAVGARPRPSTG